jgi:hypothetical protein
MRQSEHVLYITLVDFLLQLVFLGLIIGVVYAVAAKGDKDEIKKVEEIKQKLGVSDLTKLTDDLTRLAPLQAMGSELESAVNSVGGVQNAKKLLEDQAKKQLGQGHVSCLQNGIVVVIFDAYEDHIEVRRPFSPEFKEILTELHVGTPISPMTFNSFKTTFSPLLTHHPECRFNAKVVEHSHDSRPRDVLTKVFWLKIIERFN